MVVDFRRFVESPEAVVREVLAFVGADETRCANRQLEGAGLSRLCMGVAGPPLRSRAPHALMRWRSCCPLLLRPHPHPHPPSHLLSPPILRAASYRFRPLPAGMKTDYGGRRMDPCMRRAVAARWFRRPNAELMRMLGLEGADPLGWDKAAAGGGA